MSGSGLCWVPDADGNLSSTGRESHVGLLDLSPAGEDSHEGGLETSLQAFQDTCVLFFFFSFHYQSHSGESKHKQTNQTTRRQGVDGEGRATSMYMLSCSRTDHPASCWDGVRTSSEGARFPFRGAEG